MSRHAQIVIGAPDGDIFFPPRILFGEWETFGIPQYAFEHTVRVVLFLLRNLVTEKVFVGEES